MAADAYADFHRTSLERSSVAARDRYERNGGIALAAAGLGALSGVLGYWLWNRDTVDRATKP